MLTRSSIAVLGITALVGLGCWSEAAVARLTANGTSINGIATNGLMINGLMINGQRLSSTTALRAVRIVLPNGTELTFR
jgi:hypothetical protein